MAIEKSAKKVNPAVMHMLKAIVDYRVPGLRSRVSDAVAARGQIPAKERDIADLERAIDMTARFDPGEAREYREFLEIHQQALSILQRTVDKGCAAADDLHAADRFYAIFNAAIAESMTSPERLARRKRIDNKIAELRAQYNALDVKAARLDSQISACWINVDSRPAGSDVYEQALNDLRYLNVANDEVLNQMSAIMRTIKELEKQR